jgi:hypothetical protein
MEKLGRRFFFPLLRLCSFSFFCVCVLWLFFFLPQKQYFCFIGVTLTFFILVLFFLAVFDRRMKREGDFAVWSWFFLFLRVCFFFFCFFFILGFFLVSLYTDWTRDFFFIFLRIVCVCVLFVASFRFFILSFRQLESCGFSSFSLAAAVTD